MQLLVRTIIIIALGFILLGSAGFVMQRQLEDFSERGSLAEHRQDSRYLWDNFLLRESEEIILQGQDLHQNNRIAEYLYNGDTKAFSAYALPLVNELTSGREGRVGRAGRVGRVAIFDRQGKNILNSEVRLNSRVPVPPADIKKILNGEETQLNGLGYDDRLQLLQSVVLPIAYKGEIVGATVYSQSMDEIFHRLRDVTDSHIFLVNRYNRTVAGQPPILWDELIPQFEDTTAGGFYSIMGSDERAYRIVKFPLSYMFGSLQAFGVRIDDVTDYYNAERRLYWILTVAFLSVGFLIVTAVAIILRHNFRPLQEGAGFLLALANNSEVNSLGGEFNDDEIGRILNSVETLRLRSIHLKRLRRSRIRQRQRVHDLLLQEMSNLADNLDDDARREIMQDLHDMKHEINMKHEITGGKNLNGGGEELQEESANELVAIASAFRKLAGRVTAKQENLNKVIDDLEEALKTERAYFALQKELNIAHDVQLSFIPDTGLQVGQVQLLGYMSPAKTVGGDLFDYFVIDDEHVGFCVGDVSDKGVPAALFMMVARIVLWLIARNEESAGEALKIVSNAIFENNPNDFFVSIFYGRINIKTGRVDYVCAGHPPAIYIGKDAKKAVEVETANDLVVGILADIEFTEHSLQLNPGDALFVYSDGVSEAMDIQDNQYSPERLLEILSRKSGDDSVDGMISRVIDDVKEFTGDCPQSDDITCIALRYAAD